MFFEFGFFEDLGGEAVMLEDEEEDEAAAKGPTLNHPSA